MRHRETVADPACAADPDRKLHAVQARPAWLALAGPRWIGPRWIGSAVDRRPLLIALMGRPRGKAGVDGFQSGFLFFVYSCDTGKFIATNRRAHHAPEMAQHYANILKVPQ